MQGAGQGARQGSGQGAMEGSGQHHALLESYFEVHGDYLLEGQFG